MASHMANMTHHLLYYGFGGLLLRGHNPRIGVASGQSVPDSRISPSGSYLQEILQGIL
jgi:hypothetical protein